MPMGIYMNVDLVFKIAAIGIIVAILNQLLVNSKRDEQATLVTIAGLVAVLVVVVREIAGLFDTVRTIFGF